MALLPLKLALVATALLLASLAGKRGGHAVAGIVSGLPMVIGPVLGLMLLEGQTAQVQTIARAALLCFPGMLLHALVFAALAQRGWSWPVCIAAAVLAFTALATLLLAWTWPMPVAVALGLLLPSLTMRTLQRQAQRLQAELQRSGQSTPAHGAVPLPPSELLWRVTAAVALAATVLAGAPLGLPDAVSGALLALPIAGSVLPCFTLPRHGALATLRLLAGFARGLHGMVSFTLVMVFALPLLPPAAAWALGVLAAALAAAAAQRL